MIIDVVAPNPPYALARSRMIDADPATTMKAVQTANLMDAPVARLLTWVRDRPNQWRARWRGEPVTPLPRHVSFADLPDDNSFKVLGTKENEQYVAGAIGRFWQRDYGWVDFDPDQFVGFDEPGYAKTVIGFHAVPRGPERTMLIYESRTVVTDRAARKRFGRYWWFMRPFVGMLLTSALNSIEREADRMGHAEVIDLRKPSEAATITTTREAL
ncbi:MAG: hypothetical protein ACR2QE_02350 [Acidimicrobiales bacterium]